MLVRAAAIDDLEAMVELLQILFSQELDFAPNADKQRRALLRILASPDAGQLIVADTGAKVVGMVSLLFTISTAEGALAAWLEDMVVHPEFRERRIGSSLLEAAITTCQAKGIRRVTLLTDRENQSAQRFYLRHGFARSAMVPLRRRC